MSPSFSSDLKSVQDIAEDRGWSPKRVRRLICEGLPVVKIGRQSLVNQCTLDRFLEERQAPLVRCKPRARPGEPHVPSAGGN
jgi:hypothetical protein